MINLENHDADVLIGDVNNADNAPKKDVASVSSVNPGETVRMVSIPDQNVQVSKGKGVFASPLSNQHGEGDAGCSYA